MTDIFNTIIKRQTAPVQRILVVVGMLVSLFSLSVANAQVYRYEEGGKVTYGDQAPNSGLTSGHSVLSNSGVVLKKVKSREERRIARQEQQVVDDLRRRDRTLLRTFTEEEDLTRTRDERLGLVDGQIARLDDRARISKERLSIINQRIRAAEQAKGVGNAPPNLYAEQASIKKKIEKTWTQVDAKTVERKKIASEFESDLARYRWLKNGGRSN